MNSPTFLFNISEKIFMSLKYRTVEPKQEGLNNGNIQLTKIIDFFPIDSIGANNKVLGVGKMLTIQYKTGGRYKSFLTDIDGGHNFFRARGIDGTKGLISDLDIKGGDTIKIIKVSPYVYEIVKDIS